MIGISPYISSETSQVEYHPKMKAIYLNQENNDWCYGHGLSFTVITYGFVFDPGRNRFLEMLQDKSGFDLVPGMAVCLTNSMKKRKRGKNNSMKSVIDTTYERMLTCNVATKREK